MAASSRKSARLKRPVLRVLITAGPTREYIDPVRYLSNDSSGRMGFELARAAARRGHAVTLVHGPVALMLPRGVATQPVVSAADMLRECRTAWPGQDVLIMAAAVADYTPVRPARRKRKKDAGELSLRLKPTTDILAALTRRRRAGQVVIGFALEDRTPRRNAEKKLSEKRLDAIVLNSPAAIGAAESTIEVLTRCGAWRTLNSARKASHARTIIALAEQLSGGLEQTQSNCSVTPPSLTCRRTSGSEA